MTLNFMTVSDQTTESFDIVLSSTGRAGLSDALSWLGEDRPMSSATDWSRLLRAIIDHVPASELRAHAIRRTVKELTRSEIDTARVIFDSGNLPSPQMFADAVRELIEKSPNGTFAGLTPRAILRAQIANEMAVESLCLVAGVSYNEAIELFGQGNASWDIRKIELLHEYLSALVAGEIASPIPNSVPSRAVELVFSDSDGWDVADRLRADGVPYELLLVQRAVGGAWLAHKNKTSNYPNIGAADLVSARLVERNIDFRRATTVGGTSKQRDLQQLSGISNKRIGIVALFDSMPKVAIAFSSARDGGTARANGDGLLTIPSAALPLALVLTGLGWSDRTETDRLAVRFSGLLFTERNINELVDYIETLMA